MRPSPSGSHSVAECWRLCTWLHAGQCSSEGELHYSESLVPERSVCQGMCPVSAGSHLLLLCSRMLPGWLQWAAR